MSDLDQKAAERISKDRLNAILTRDRMRKQEAEDIVSTAEKKAADILTKAQDASEQKRTELQNLSDEVLKTFIEEDSIKRHANLFVRLIAAIETIKSEHEALSPWIIKLVEVAVRKVVGEFEKPELIARLVQTTIAELDLPPPIEIHAHTRTEADVKDATKLLPENLGDNTSVIVDPFLDPGLLRIHCAYGQCEFSFETRLEQLLQELSESNFCGEKQEQIDAV